MIVAAFISDRGDLYINQCLAAFQEHVDLGLISAHEVFDDSAHELGMAGNAQAAWDWAREMDADFLLHCEEDMLFTRSVPLKEMRHILEHNEHLAQVVLKRHPWSVEETAAGGQMECHPDGTFAEQVMTSRLNDEVAHHYWMEHRTLFSMNPSLIPRDVLDIGWQPGTQGVERAITDACFDVGYSFAYYGRRDDPPYVRHIGHIRAEGHRW